VVSGATAVFSAVIGAALLFGAAEHLPTAFSG
jgi:hypothetical protein